MSRGGVSHWGFGWDMEYTLITPTVLVAGDIRKKLIQWFEDLRNVERQNLAPRLLHDDSTVLEIFQSLGWNAVSTIFAAIGGSFIAGVTLT